MLSRGSRNSAICLALIFLPLLFLPGVVEARTYDSIIQVGDTRAAVFYPKGYKASASSNRKWPTMLFAPGLAGGANSYNTLLGKIADAGFLVVAIEHGDKVAFKRLPPRSGDRRWKIFRYMRKHPFTHETYGYRPREFREFARRVVSMLPVDTGRLVFAGHSMGGYSIFNALQGSAVKPVALVTYSTGELNWKKGHPYFTSQQLAKMKLPLLMFVGEREYNKDKGSYASEIKKSYGGNSELVVLENGRHIDYGDSRWRIGRRKKIRRINKIADRTLTFLKKVMK
jgi:pimeloyl-ACP methyl ester carboxylesterase